ncbi:MAG: L-2-hydroxyglutarate oxidase, partial [Acidobacteria bacterium]|nr:L-2-hydroxyglutarate oxidase [Acidobacteriota bacterium]
LKAELCVRGAAAMVEFCRQHAIPHEVCGKLIVAGSEAELAGLAELERRAVVNRVPGVRRLRAEEIREFEPHATGVAAVLVPGTGIVKFAEVAARYALNVKAKGGEVLTGAGVLAINASSEGFALETSAGPFQTSSLINCAGLQADRIARMAGANPKLQLVPFRGEYYVLRPQRRGLVRALIYPVPDPRFPFLGVHFTRRITGEVEAGPNAVLALKREGYRKTDFNFRDSVELLGYSGFWHMAKRFWRTGAYEAWRSANKRVFVRNLQRLVPELQEGDVEPGGSGVRAQAVAPDGGLLDDFYFLPQGRALHVCNVPSPAATASLVIGERICEIAARQFDWQ